jgi:hypothetical protein
MHRQENAIRELVDQLNSAEPKPIPPNMVTVEAMIEHTFDYGKDQLMGTEADDDDGSQVLPTWTLLTQSGQVVIIVTPFDNGSMGKDMVAEGIKKLMSEAHVIRYTFLSEAWTASQTTAPTDYDIPPSKRLDRKEVLMVTGADRKSGETLRIWDIVRDEDGSVVDLKLNEDLNAPGGNSEGRFTGLLEVARH